MIYQKFGCTLTVIGNCGEHQPPYLNYDALLLKVHYEDDGQEGFQFAELLRADKGFHEILHAAESAPRIILTDDELKAAFKDAE